MSFSRSVLVRKFSLVGLGRQGTKITARLKLGKTAGANPSVFVDWKRRLLAMGRVDSRRLKLDCRTVHSWKRSLNKNGTLRGDALKRLRAALVGAG